MTKGSANSDTPNSQRLVLLEKDIAYDWDDYDVWGAFYFDLDTREIRCFKYGHGSGNPGEKNEVMEYHEALKQGLVGIRELALAVIKVTGFSCRSTYGMPSCNCALPCSIKRGRKMKGDDLILVSVFREKSFVQPLYGGETSYDTFGLVYNPEMNLLCKTAFGNIDIKEWSRAEYIANAIEADPGLIGILVHCLAYHISYSACDSGYKAQNLSHLLVKGLALSERPNMEDAVDPWEEKKNRGREERKRAKQEKARSDVEAWARDKMKGKSEEEIQRVIQRTLDKYYS